MNVLHFRFQATRVLSILVYGVIIVAALSLADRRLRNAAEAAPFVAPAAAPAVENTKPFFSLSSNRTFGTTESPRVWLDYRGMSSLDFRVYRVNDPARFFAELSDPHQMGKAEEEELATTLQRRRSLLERIRSVKAWAYSGIRNYFRDQLKQNTRKSFNEKFRPAETARRTPLNVADYARVPLLNPNQLVTSWREPLPALETEYDRRMVPLGKRESGVYLIEAVGQELRAYTIVVVTDLAMVEKSSPTGDLLVYAVDRRTGVPRADAQVEIVKAQQTVTAGRTNADGVFRAKIAKDPAERELDDPEIGPLDSNRVVILASQRDNFAISDLESFYFADNGMGEESVQGYIYTDRPIYRPTHQVFFKGILRSVDEQGHYSSLKSQTVSVTVKDPNDAMVYQQELKLSSRGTFHGELTLADEAPLGVYQIVATMDEGGSNGSFEVAEYKKPEYKVTVVAPQKFVSAGGKSKFEINARYFFGAPVANAEVKYYIYRSRYYPSYWETDDDTEPELDDDVDYSEYGNYYSNEMVLDGEGKLDASGSLEVPFEVPANNETDAWDFQYRLDVEVTDASRRSITGSASLIATRGNVITRTRPDRYVYTPGQTAQIKVSTTDYEGHPTPAKVTLKFMSRTYVKVEQKQNEYDPDYKLQENEIGSAEVTTNGEGEAVYNFPVSGAGSIAIKTVLQQNDRTYTSLGGSIWIACEDEGSLESDAYYDEASTIKLVPDKKSYRVGETAHVLAMLPTAGANLLVTTERESVMSARQVKVSGRTTILDVLIEADYAPDVFLSVTFVKDGDMYTNDRRLVVPARDKLLDLEIISNKQEYKPRETASYTVLARDADGAPVRDVEVSLGVVDEAIYSVSSDYSRNIRQQFYGQRYNSVQTHLSISYWFTGYAGEKPMDLASTKRSYQLADFKNEGQQVQPMIRKEFKDTAYWQPTAITGSDGRATVKFRLPDNLTTWRATARAVTSDTRVGIAKSKVIARKDVILRLETPRFLTQGDTVTLSGIVHNYLKQSKSTQISIAVGGARLVGPAQQTVTIDQQGEHRVDWQVSAPQTGQITLVAKALTDTESDAVEMTLDVVPRGLHETKAERWVTTDEIAEQQFSLEIPADADMNSRRLRVEVAPSIAGTLFGALDYLTSYPYGCTEQTMSSFLPNIIVSSTLKELKSTSIRDRDDLQKKVERGRNRLYAFQHQDGGWGWWKDDQTDPFMTAYVIDGLTLAKQAGYEIDDERMARGREQLQSMLDSGAHNRESDAGGIDADARAFMIYALAESGGVEGRHLEKLFTERSNLQPYGRALLALTLSLHKMDQRADELAGEIERSAQVSKSTAHWRTKRPSRLDFSEEDFIEGTALSLKALTRIKPNSPLLPLAARWLVTERHNGYYWNSTKDTAFAIFGLIDFVKLSRELTPSYDLEVYVNGETVVAEHVSDASATRVFLFNRKGAAVGATNHIRIVKRGKGSLYFSSAVEYYTDDESVSARGSSELNVTREYYRLKVEADGDKLKWAMSPLTGEIHSGDLIVVKLRLAGKPARHLMLEDPIPSGAEQLESVGNLHLDYTNSGWSDHYSSREFRDRRTVFFLDRFDGDVRFQYAIRVQIPGEFVVAPARIELMYEPSVNANTATQRFSFLN
jgi:uncharacterized protein YfaS (alpha-2-macroglobulin family)